MHAACYRAAVLNNASRPSPFVSTFAAALVPVALLLTLFSGCGYTVERHAGPSGADAPRIAIVTLDNDSSEPGVERLVSEALRRECLRRGRYRLVDDVSEADGILRGRVLPLAERSQTLSSVVLALEQIVTLSLELELVRPGSATVGLKTAQLTESEMFFTSADIEAARKNKTEALRRLSALLAERALDAVALDRRR